MVTTRSRSKGKSPPDASPSVSSRKKGAGGAGKKVLGSWFIWNGTWMGTSWSVSQASLLHRKRRDAKNACFDLTALVIFVATAHYTHNPIDSKNVPALTAVRAACLVGNAIMALIMRLFCNNVMPPVDQKTNPVIYGILNPVGGAAFLTYQSTTLFSLYAIVTAAAEISYARSPSTLAGRVLALVYYTSPYFQGLAVVLTLLWLKFNWFEKEWQETVIKFWEDLGFRSVALVQWIGKQRGPQTALLLHISPRFLASSLPYSPSLPPSLPPSPLLCSGSAVQATALCHSPLSTPCCAKTEQSWPN